MVGVGEGFITVARDASWARDVFRSYQVLMDGTCVAKVKRGQSVRVAVPAGRHSVRMQINWCFSPVVEIEVPEGGEARLDCGPNRKPGGALNQVLKEAANYIWLRPEGDFPEH